LVKVIAISGVIKPCTWSYTQTLRFWYPAVAHIFTHTANLASGPKSGFKNKCRTRAGFGLHNGAHLQLCSVQNREPVVARRRFYSFRKV